MFRFQNITDTISKLIKETDKTKDTVSELAWRPVANNRGLWQI